MVFRSVLFTIAFAFSAYCGAVTPPQNAVITEFNSTRTWVVLPSMREYNQIVNWINDRQTTLPPDVQELTNGPPADRYKITYASHSLSPNIGGVILPPTGDDGDQITVTSCKLSAHTVTTTTYVWDSSANNGQGGWVIIKETKIYEANMTVCPGV